MPLGNSSNKHCCNDAVPECVSVPFCLERNVNSKCTAKQKIKLNYDPLVYDYILYIVSPKRISEILWKPFQFLNNIYIDFMCAPTVIAENKMYRFTWKNKPDRITTNNTCRHTHTHALAHFARKLLYDFDNLFWNHFTFMFMFIDLVCDVIWLCAAWICCCSLRRCACVYVWAFYWPLIWNSVDVFIGFSHRT